MKLKNFTKEYFKGLKAVLEGLNLGEVDGFVKILWEAGEKGRNIFFIGNGGSASTASHMAADIGKNTVLPKSKNKWRFKTWALTDNVAWMTALGNDLSYDDIFVEQMKNLAKRGDVLVAISGSGNSLNVVKALIWAKKEGLKTVGMLGFKGGRAKGLVDLAVMVGVDHYGYVEGVHSEIQHCVIEALKVKVKEAK